jgi:Tfp pilus assembly protein PilX
MLRKNLYEGQRGAALITGLLVTLVLTILALGAMMSTSTALNISGNSRAALEAFYIAEAGTEEGRARLQVTSPNLVPDTNPLNANWFACIGTLAECQAKGYNTSDTSNHFRYNRLSLASFNDIVIIRHKVNGAGTVLRWGDSNGDGISEENTTTGNSIYVITSQGTSSSGGVKSVKIEAVHALPINAPSALYTKENTTAQGSSTYITGMDACGSRNVPGILTTQSVNTNGHPDILGNPGTVQHSTLNINVQDLVNQYKAKADYSYNESGTHSGMHWGNPASGATQQSPLTCSEHHVVYYNTNSTYLQLTGQSSGCGILLVEGDLDLHGGFQWYGVILTTGSITYTGGGEKNVTGAIMAGGQSAIDLVGGNANIIYCSQAVDNQSSTLPLVTLKWAEIFG